jgi:four helix bundle suffix protein
MTDLIPTLMRFKKQKCTTLEQVQALVTQERKTARYNQGRTRPTEVSVGCVGQWLSLVFVCFVAKTTTDNQERERPTEVSVGFVGQWLSLVFVYFMAKTTTDNQGRTRPTDASVGRAGQCLSLSSSCLAANAALVLITVTCSLLDRQVERLAKDFETEGGFTERLYKIRSAKRKEPPK